MNNRRSGFSRDQSRLKPLLRHIPKQGGFTLIEVIMVIVIIGIISPMVTLFIKRPIDQYIDIARRAEMTDIADTALRRMARDIRTAVPNSLRLLTSAGSTYVEFLPTKAGGRYRANPSPSGTAKCGGTLAEDKLDFTIADSCFEVLGPQIPFATGDAIVVGSTDSSLPYSTAASGVLRNYTGTLGYQSVVKFTGTPLSASAEYSSQRFQVVDHTQKAVTYSCVGTPTTLDANNDGQMTLTRYWNYWNYTATSTAPAASATPAGGSSAILADKISGCEIVYNVVNQRNALVAITLTLTRGGESISLYHEIHVNNSP